MCVGDSARGCVCVCVTERVFRSFRIPTDKIALSLRTILSVLQTQKCKTPCHENVELIYCLWQAPHSSSGSQRRKWRSDSVQLFRNWSLFKKSPQSPLWFNIKQMRSSRYSSSWRNSSLDPLETNDMCCRLTLGVVDGVNSRWLWTGWELCGLVFKHYTHSLFLTCPPTWLLFIPRNTNIQKHTKTHAHPLY